MEIEGLDNNEAGVVFPALEDQAWCTSPKQGIKISDVSFSKGYQNHTVQDTHLFSPSSLPASASTQSTGRTDATSACRLSQAASSAPPLASAVCTSATNASKSWLLPASCQQMKNVLACHPIQRWWSEKIRCCTYMCALQSNNIALEHFLASKPPAYASESLCGTRQQAYLSRFLASKSCTGCHS